MLVTGDNPVCAKIVEALGLKGQNAYAVTVRIAIGEPVTATVERRLTKDEVGKLAELMPELQPQIVDKYSPVGGEIQTAKLFWLTRKGWHFVQSPHDPLLYKSTRFLLNEDESFKAKYGGVGPFDELIEMAIKMEETNFANAVPIQEGEQYPTNAYPWHRNPDGTMKALQPPKCICAYTSREEAETAKANGTHLAGCPFGPPSYKTPEEAITASIGKDEEWVDLPPVIKSFKQLVKSVYPLAYAKKLVNGWSIHSGGLLPMIDMIAFEETEYKAWEKAAEPFVSTLPKGHGLTQGWLNRQIEKAADTVKSLPEWMQKSCTCPVEVLTLSGCKCGGK